MVSFSSSSAYDSKVYDQVKTRLLESQTEMEELTKQNVSSLSPALSV